MGDVQLLQHQRRRIVGHSWTSSSERHAFLWELGTTRELESLGGADSAAWAINERGQVVGDSQTPLGDQHAVLWTR
jgi:probable HAF family extracellular repeat protein